MVIILIFIIIICKIQQTYCLDVLSESFSLPLSPAESDTSSDKKEESSESTPKPKRSINRGIYEND